MNAERLRSALQAMVDDHSWDDTERQVYAEALAALRDSDGTAPAAACEDMPVPDRTAKRGSARTSPRINRSNPHG